MRARKSLAAATAALFALTAIGLAGTAVAWADSATQVFPGALSSADVSPAGTPWDRNPGASQSAYASARFTPSDLPSSGDAPWKRDIEAKPPGQIEVAAAGLVLGVTSTPPTKARVQYYVGSGGYPAIDEQAPTLATLLAQTLSWTQTLLRGVTDYGVTLQVQLQKEVSPGQWARVTAVSVWDPGTGVRDLAGGLWFANSDIHADGFLTGTKVNTRQSGPGVSASVLLANFGDFEVVSFGPNLGRDGRSYAYAVQDFHVLGQTFHFGLEPGVTIDPYVVAGAQYRGLGVDIRTTGITDATSVRVTVHRAVGSDVVKTSKPTGIVIPTLNAGGTVTAPIVIRAGTYDEVGSSSWVRPDVLWAVETVPTGVTVDVLRGDAVLASTSSDAFGSAAGATLADVMPSGTPAFTNPAANYHSASDYRGIAVDVRIDQVTDAEQIVVRVDRSNGPAVIKTSKPTALMFALINTGSPRSITVPIVIQAGSYDEGGSSSWIKPGAIWTPTSVPTSVTVTIDRRYGPDLVTTLPIGTSSAIATDVLPVATVPTVIVMPTDAPLDVSVPAGATDVSVDLGTPTMGGEVTVPVQVSVQSAAGANLVIPAATKITAVDPTWDGVIKLPVVVPDITVSVPGSTTTVALAIEVGSASTRLEFDAPVQLVLVGQAGKRAGFVQGGVFHAIDTACPVTAPTGMTSEECWLDQGADLVIWTMHFTTFVSYDAVVGPTPSGGGGSSSGSTGTTGGRSPEAVATPPATVKPATVPTVAPTPRPSATPTPSPDAPEAAEPSETAPPAAGGFDPVLLIVIVIAVAVLGAAVATIVTVRRRARG